MEYEQLDIFEKINTFQYLQNCQIFNGQFFFANPIFYSYV